MNSTINYSLVNGKFQNGDGDLFYIVGVDKSSADCKTGEVCTFSFDEIKPTIDIKKEDIGVTTYSIEGEVSGDKRNGKGREYYKNGRLMFEGEFKNGKRWTGRAYEPEGNVAGVQCMRSCRQGDWRPGFPRHLRPSSL